MATNGSSSHSNATMPTWNPAALLQPGRRGLNAANPEGMSASRASPTTSRYQAESEGENSMAFQFASSTSDTSDAAPSGASTPGSIGGNPMSGVGGWIERVNHVQSRSSLPQVKRRRVDDTREGSQKTNMPVRSGGGNLGAYVKEQRKQGDGARATAGFMVDLTNNNDDDDDDVQEINHPNDEEVCYGMLKTRLNCVKVPSPKPGSQSIWGPGYLPGIKIILKRAEGDTTLRIPASDHTREIIGNLEPVTAAALCPLLDSNIRLRTDCRVPSQPKQPGEQPGQPTSRAYSIDIVLYGPLKYVRSIGVHLKRHNQLLVTPHMVQKGIRVQNPHIGEFRPPAPKSCSTNLSGNFASVTARTVEEVRSEVMGVFDSLTRGEDMPTMDPPPIILTPLLNHQKQGLYFMVTRELPREEKENETGIVSFWQSKIAANGQKVFNNVITGHTQKVPPEDTRGGILADMMGLGKTLSILSLIASTLDDSRRWHVEAPAQPSNYDAKALKQNKGEPQPTLGLTNITRNVKTTLIVCPLSTVTNWEEQLKQHVQAGSLSYHIYHGPNRIKDLERLGNFDIIVTTYGSVSNELSSRRKGKEGAYPLEELAWFRIVLDEAHMIREQSTVLFKAICRLQACRKWAVTGTPVQNRLDDLAALLAFLRLEPFHDRSKFLRYIVEPFKACDPEIVPKMRVLVDSITLRRLKDKIDLPPREDLVVKLEFSADERRIYDLFAKNAQDRVKVLAGSGNNKGLGGSTYIHILKAILRLRLLCAHGKDLLNENDIAALRGMTAEMAIAVDDEDDDDEGPALSHQKAHEMFNLMQDTNNDACIECGRKLGVGDGTNVDSEAQDDIVGFMTPCFHVICRLCISNYKDRAKTLLEAGQAFGACPVCSSYVRFEFVELHRTDVEAEHDGLPKRRTKGLNKQIDKYDGPHTKTAALIEDLLRSKFQSEANPFEPPVKSVVFSGWTSHLDLIELALKAASIGFTRLDGTMTRTSRTAAMDRFREDDSIHVILVSIMAGGLGLNLTSGSNVYVMEPQFNPAAEAQAIDRVHRLGQKRPVRTIRYIMRDSFEEKMVELQEKKMKLASLSIDGQKRLDKAEASRQKLMDIRSLFK